MSDERKKEKQEIGGRRNTHTHTHTHTHRVVHLVDVAGRESISKISSELQKFLLPETVEREEQVSFLILASREIL